MDDGQSRLSLRERTSFRGTKADKDARPVIARGCLVLIYLVAAVRFFASHVVADERHATDAAAAAQAATPEQARTGYITGHVVSDADRSPKADATVWLLSPTPPNESFYSWPLPLRRVTADANGEFSFDNVPPGKYQVWANLGKQTSRSERLHGSTVTVAERGPASEPVELRLRDGVALKVRAVAARTREPIAGAVVLPHYSDLGEDFRTDETGESVLKPLTSEVWAIDVSADGYMRQTHHVNLHHGGDASLEVKLVPGGLVEGIVRDEQHRPIAKARVGLSQGMQGLGTARTAEDGSYHLRNAPRAGQVEVYVSAPGLQSQRQALRMSAGKGHYDFTLAPYSSVGSIQGVVVGPEGAPIAGARLINRAPNDDEVSETTTGPDGRFRMEKLYEGFNDVSVVVRASGFAPQRVVVMPGTADAPSEIKIELQTGHSIAGRVVDEDGRPLDDVLVSYAGGANSLSGVGGQTSTDADGRFELDSLPADCPFAFYRPHYSNIQNRRLTLDAEGTVTVVMSPSGVVRGRAINAATGEPIHSFTVRATSPAQRLPTDPQGGIRSELVRSGELVSTGDGSFEVGDLLLGMPLQLIVEAEGFQRQIVPRVKAQSADQASAVEFRLIAEDPRNLVAYRGRVLDLAGKPVADVELRLLAADKLDDAAPRRMIGPRFAWQSIRQERLASDASVLRFDSAISDEEGRFEFSRIPREAVVEVAWWSSGWAPGRRQNLEGLSEDERNRIELQIQPGAQIAGRIDRTAYPKAEMVNIRDEKQLFSFDPVRLKPDQENFEFSDLPPGEYQVILIELGQPRPAPAGGVGVAFGRPSKMAAAKKVTLEPGSRQQIELGPDTP